MEGLDVSTTPIWAWNEEILYVLCSGYVRKHLTDIRIDDIALIVSYYIADFSLKFMYHSAYCDVRLDRILPNTLQCSFNKVVKKNANGLSAIIFAPPNSDFFL